MTPVGTVPGSRRLYEDVTPYGTPPRTLSRKPAKTRPQPLDVRVPWRRPRRANGSRIAHRARRWAEGRCDGCAWPTTNGLHAHGCVRTAGSHS